MNFTQFFFATVFLICCVHSYRSESERSVPVYEASVDETQDNEESIGTSVNRADKPNTATTDQNQGFSQLEEDFQQKSNKKDSKDHKNSKKATNVETEENIYNKEFKKKSNGKGYHKKYNKQNSERKVYDQESRDDFNADASPHESIHKRFSHTSEGTDSSASERVERSAKLEPEPIEEEQAQQVKYHKQDKNRKFDSKSGEYDKYMKKSKNGSKRQKRSYSYFGFWE